VGRTNLARFFGEAGDPGSARDQFAELLPVRVAALRAKHPDTLDACASLARWTGEAGDVAGARQQFAALVPELEQVCGTEHPDTLDARTRLAHWTHAEAAPTSTDEHSAPTLSLYPPCNSLRLGASTRKVPSELGRWELRHFHVPSGEDVPGEGAHRAAHTLPHP
jgi:hypothetical protein